VAVSVGAIMRREWCDPFETSMSDLGVTTVWLGEHLDTLPPESLRDLVGLVVELSREVMGSPATEMLFELPVAGVPVAPESASIAQSLGIRTILWGEDEARAWLTELEGGRKSAPAPLLAVWGSAGAPGATSLAIGLSHELAKSRPVVLLDADFVAPSVSELLGLPGDHSGLLGALRVARNDSPQWESLLGCATPFGDSSSLQVLSGIRPGGLGRLEAGAMSALIETVLAAGVAVVVDTKCALGTAEHTPEKTAVDAVLRCARQVFWVSRSTDLGVSRLVRDWNLLSEMTDGAGHSILLRASDRPDGVGFTQASEAVWGLTGCLDIRSLPNSQSPLYGAWLARLLGEGRGQDSRGASPDRAPRAGLGQSLRALLTKARSEPLP
jgi:Mrp family chromosome partitioning ATPase